MSQIYKPSTGGGGGGGIETISGDTGSISGSSVTIYANNAIQNSGSTVEFVNSGTISTLNVTDSGFNTFISNGAGSATNTGTYNTGLGADAGSNYTGTESSNIAINNTGTAAESHTLRIGAGTGTGTQQLNHSYISGIYGATPQDVNVPRVILCDNTDNLTSISSSTSGFVLTSNGTSAPSFQAASGGSISVDGDTGTATGSTLVLHAYDTTNLCGGSVLFENATNRMILHVTDSDNNTFLGNLSGNNTVSGTGSTALGKSSLASITSGANQVAIGLNSLTSSTADTANISIGSDSLSVLNGGSNSVAMGYQSGKNLASGSYNILLGTSAGTNLSSNESSNINLNSLGVMGDNHTLRIGASTGTGDQQLNAAFICGISGISPSIFNIPQVVLCDSQNKLSSITSDTSGFVLTSNGTSGAPPSFQTLPASSITITGDSSFAAGSTISLVAFDGANVCGGSVDFIGNGVSKMSLQVTDVNNNTFLGNISGNNTIFVTGTSNSGFGAGSLSTLGSGSSNTSIGVGSMGNLIDGANCVAVGSAALGTSVHDSFNTCVGANSFLALDGGSNNTAIGYNAGTGAFTGSYNCFFGVDAGSGYSSTESHNININNNGTFTDQHTLRIGAGTGTGTQQLTHAYISGITGSTPSSGNIPQVVLCDNADNITVISSGSSGQVLTSNGSATPSFQSIPNSFPWSNKATSFSALASNGYFVTAAATATLPASPSVGDTISFIVDTGSAFVIQASGSQQIRFGSSTSSAGGTLTNSAQGDSMTLVYSSSSGNWVSLNATGSWAPA